MTFASGATPEKLDPRPAAIPATWVPWKQALSSRQGAPEPGPIIVSAPLGQAERIWSAGSDALKHASATILFSRNGWVASTPVSMTATVWPRPRMPRAQAWGARISGTVLASSGSSGMSSCTEATTGSARSASRPADVTSARNMGAAMKVSPRRLPFAAIAGCRRCRLAESAAPSWSRTMTLSVPSACTRSRSFCMRIAPSSDAGRDATASISRAPSAPNWKRSIAIRGPFSMTSVPFVGDEKVREIRPALPRSEGWRHASPSAAPPPYSVRGAARLTPFHAPWLWYQTGVPSAR